MGVASWSVGLALWFGTSFVPRAAQAATDAPAADKTLSPYFVVEGADSNVEALPLESTKVDVQVTGVIAEVTVTQAYKNAGKKPINAQYVFPASTRAAVHGMRMQIRDQINRGANQGKAASRAGLRGGETSRQERQLARARTP